MKIIQENIGEFAQLTGYLHEPNGDMNNIEVYPAIIILPGGGFRFCSDREAEPVAMNYFAEGFQAFVLRYTTTGKKTDAVMEDPMKDVQDTLRLIGERKKDYRVADGKMAILGFSGGGHLAAASATHGPLRPDALLLAYPGILHSDLRALECPDILEAVDDNTPPTFLFGTANDKITPPRHPMAFAKALDDVGVGFELHIFREGVHGLSLAKPWTSGGDSNMVNMTVARWFSMSQDWLKAEFGEFPVEV